MFWQKKPDEPTREHLIDYAARYFYKHAEELSAGTIKTRQGDLCITLSFVVDGEKGTNVK